jgi:hypothetical protein
MSLKTGFRIESGLLQLKLDSLVRNVIPTQELTRRSLSCSLDLSTLTKPHENAPGAAACLERVRVLDIGKDGTASWLRSLDSPDHSFAFENRQSRLQPEIRVSIRSHILSPSDKKI